MESIVSERLSSWFEENPKDSKLVITKIFEAAAAREAARKARDVLRKNSALEVSSLPGKLADCQDKSPENSELFIVEEILLEDQPSKLETEKIRLFCL